MILLKLSTNIKIISAHLLILTLKKCPLLYFRPSDLIKAFDLSPKKVKLTFITY